MFVKTALTQEELKKVFIYDPITGHFIRNYSVTSYRKGTVAGTKLNSGYISIRVAGMYYQAHRLVWLYITGMWPSEWIDHINGKKDDNRFENLRDTSWSMNMHNLKSAKKHNKSGLLGVSPFKSRWIAQIQKNGQKIHIGVYDTPDAAHQAYLSKKKELNLMCPQQT